MTDVVVVDFDCITAAGDGVDATWQALSHNQSGVRRIDRYDPAGQSLQGVAAIAYGAQVPLSFAELAGSEAAYRKWCEPAYHAVTGIARRLLTRVNFKSRDRDLQRVGFIGATALTSQTSREVIARSGQADSKFILNQCHNIPLAAAAAEWGIQGPSFSIGGACASSAHAVMLVSQLIQAGALDSAVVVGHEFPILPYSVGGLDWVSALYRRDKPDDRAWAEPAKASRPYSADRRGFVLAEGVGAVLLASRAHAELCGWPTRARIAGMYCNSDADHLTRISTGNVERCMAGAIKSAGRTPAEIECINAHATSTPIGDKSELLALASLFGEGLRRVPVVANKSQLGHSLGASAMLALICAVKGMEEQVALPTLNHVRDPGLPDAFVPDRAIEWRHHRTLLNSFGFGGTNVSLVVERMS